MTFAMVGSVCAPGILNGRPAVVPSAVSSKTTQTDFLHLLVRIRASLGTQLDFHHVPGRLRLRGDALKRNWVELEEIRDEFAEVPGVRSASANRLTGSVVVEYDPWVLPAGAISGALQGCSATGTEDGQIWLPSWTEHLVASAIEWVLEKLAIALIAAVA